MHIVGLSVTLSLLTSEGAPELRWPFGVVLHWGEMAGPLYPGFHQSLGVGSLGWNMTPGKAAPQGDPWRGWQRALQATDARPS